MTRRGLTLVEVLVVIAIVVILVGLLLPATRQVRGPANRVMCQNNLKQLLLSLHSAADADGGRNRLPAGTVWHPTLPPDERLSWYVPLLPFVEELPTAATIDPFAGHADAVHAAGTGRVIKVFLCPGLPRPPQPEPLTHYPALAGVGADAAALPAGAPRAGAFGTDRRTGLRDVADGLSSTAILLETGRDPGRWAAGGFPTIRPLDPVEVPAIGRERPFGGRHEGGANMGLADGSVRFVRDAIPPAVLAALATANGGDAVPPEW